jgi:dCMP deaminase
MTRDHKYYMDRAGEFQSLSVDPKMKVGAVIVDTEGYWSGGRNQAPKSHWHHQDEDNKTVDYVIHAEVSALSNFFSESLEQGHLHAPHKVYITHSPCERCAATLYEFGIKEVYYGKLHKPEGIELLERLGVKVDKVEGFEERLNVSRR